MEVPHQKLQSSSLTIAQRAHDDGVVVVADLLADGVVLHPLQRVNEAEDAGDGSQDQHVRVEAQPGEVNSNLDAEIVFDVVQRLRLPEFLQLRKF